MILLWVFGGASIIIVCLYVLKMFLGTDVIKQKYINYVVSGVWIFAGALAVITGFNMIANVIGLSDSYNFLAKLGYQVDDRTLFLPVLWFMLRSVIHFYHPWHVHLPAFSTVDAFFIMQLMIAVGSATATSPNIPAIFTDSDYSEAVEVSKPKVTASDGKYKVVNDQAWSKLTAKEKTWCRDTAGLELQPANIPQKYKSKRDDWQKLFLRRCGYSEKVQ